MSNHRNYYADLAAKAGHGDTSAQVSLREQMESQMVFVVRRTMQTGVSATALDRRILAEAGRLGAHAPANLEERIRAIARVLCASVLADLAPGNRARPVAQETLADCGKSAA